MTNNLQQQPAVIVIIGATGDLARKKVIPAMYQLVAQQVIHPETLIIGTSRSDIQAQDLIKGLTSHHDHPESLDEFRSKLQTLTVDPSDVASLNALADHIDSYEHELGQSVARLVYLSVPPSAYPSILDAIAASKLQNSSTKALRLLVEKPFGENLASAQALIAQTNRLFSEDQVYRIDHFLAKEMAQNILTFRKHNPLFSAVWNNQHISSVTVTTSEDDTIENRASFYDAVGALRDQMQNHVLQLLALALMEIPDTLTASEIHARKLQVIESLRVHSALRGQYEGYSEHVGHSSATETFARLTLTSDVAHWQNTPITLLTGKGLSVRQSSIEIVFGEDDNTNTVTFYIQPNEGISISCRVKKPGYADAFETTKLNFSYHKSQNRLADAYERVLLEALEGDHTLFASDDEVLAAWSVLEPTLHDWKTSRAGLVTYPIGSSAAEVSRKAMQNT